MTREEQLVELAITNLAVEIAKQKSPYSVLGMVTSPHQIARALYLLGWRPPFERGSDD